MTSANNVLLIEDERDIAELIERTLACYGYVTRISISGADAKRQMGRDMPDICIIDLNLPDMDGMELVRELEEHPNVGVIITTGRGDVSDRVLGLEVGADDYLVKPFEPRELVARVRSLSRRLERLAELVQPQTSQTAEFAGFTFDIGSLILVDAAGVEEQLSSAEAQLLLALLKAPNRVLSRDQLLDAEGTGLHQPFDRSIDVRISRLRKKLEQDPKDPKLIKTVYGAGYLFSSKVNWL